MTLKEYFDKRKYKMFPEIEDFSQDMDKYKKINVNDLSHKEWLWFHHTAFNLLRIGSAVIGLFIFLTCGIIALFYGLVITAAFSFIIVAIMIYALRNMYKSYHLYKDMSLYDLFLREV